MLDLSLSAAINAPTVVLNDRDYLLGAFSAAAVIVGPTKPWVATEFVYIADYPPPRSAKHFRTVFREMSNLRVMVRIGRCCPDSFTSFFTVVPASARGINLRPARRAARVDPVVALRAE